MSRTQVSGSDRQEVLDAVERFTSPDSPWTSRRDIRQKAGDGTDATILSLTKKEVDETVAQLVAEGELVYWHGLVTLNDEELLKAAIEKAGEAEVTQYILIGKINKILNGRWDFEEQVPIGGGGA